MLLGWFESRQQRDAGKRKSAHINKGNPYLKSMLCEVGWVISGKRTLYLSGWYWRVKQRKGSQTSNDRLGSKAIDVDLHNAKNRNTLQRRKL